MRRAGQLSYLWFLSLLAMGLVPFEAMAQGGSSASRAEDEQAIRAILENQMSAWNSKDAPRFGRDIAEDAIYTNPRGESLVGRAAFIGQHAAIFNTVFKGTTGSQVVEELRFPADNVAIVRTLTSIAGMAAMPPGSAPDAQGRMRTKLLQVLVRRGMEWKVVAYHNVDVKPGVMIPGS